MWQAYLRDPGARLDYGYNRPGDYQANIVIGLVELAVLYLLLNPWYNRWVLVRIFMAFLLCFAWTLCFLIVSMHAGRIFSTHWFWLTAVNAVLFIGFFIKAIQIKLRR
jgi:uncharacterized membrane protein YkgB